MESWWIYQGDVYPHDGISRLPPPPPSRAFSHRLPTSRKKRRGIKFSPSCTEIEQANLALYLRRPLIVIGEPSMGGALAYSVATELKLGEVLYWFITRGTTVRDGLYFFDQIAYRQDIQLANLDKEPNLISIEKYMCLGPLGTGFLSDSYPRVLLIEDVDKATDGLLDDLSVLFEGGRFDIPELVRISGIKHQVFIQSYEGKTVRISNGRIECQEFPFVVITSEGKKRLPDSLLKQCIGLKVEIPSAEELTKWVSFALDEDLSASLRESIYAILKKSSDRYSTYQYLVDAAWMTAYTGKSIHEVIHELNNLDLLVVESASQEYTDHYTSQSFYGCYFQTERITMSKDVAVSQSGSFGVGINQGEIQTEKLAGTIYESQYLSAASKEIQSLLEQLSKSYPSNTTTEKMAIATQAVDRIEKNPTLMNRVLSAIKAGGVEALSQALNHPAASFLIAAFEDWQNTKKDAVE